MSRQPHFQLGVDAPLAQAVREAVLAQIDYALELLPGSDDEAVHETRKVCKKLRALLRLIRPRVGKACADDDDRLRRAARTLMRARLATVRIETVDRLAALDEAAFARISECLRETPSAPPVRACASAAKLLGEQRREVSRWDLDRLSAGELVAGHLRGYRRARRAWQAALDRPTSGTLHAWRKQAKYHGYQCTLMKQLSPRAGRHIKALKALSDALGWHHDLQAFSGLLARRAAELGGRDALRPARARISAERQRTQQEAWILGERLFAMKPKAWLEITHN